MDYPTQENRFQAEHAALLCQSFESLLGRPLMPGISRDPAFAETLFHAPIAVISHDAAPDPLFNYANRVALDLFEMDWDAFTQTPSRYSAAPAKWAEREALLANVRAQGFVYPLQGIRESKSGRRFRIDDGAVWNLSDANGAYRGQAACFFAWETL